MSAASNEADNDELIEAELVESGMSPGQTYNVVSDTVTGINLRVSDNVFQAIAIFVCLTLGAGIGALAFQPRILAAVAGAFTGTLVGLFGSGIWLMVYRAARHMGGRHD